MRVPGLRVPGLRVPDVRTRVLGLAEGTDLLRLRRQRKRVASLEIAVGENAALAVPLADLVGRIEQDLVPLLEASRTTSM